MDVPNLVLDIGQIRRDALNGQLSVEQLLDIIKVLQTLKGHTDAIIAMTVSPDGRHAVSGGNDQSVRLWTLPER
jgi:WD40 repeat protein